MGAKLGIAIELARILGRIHGKNIIHLALESGNILISPGRNTPVGTPSERRPPTNDRTSGDSRATPISIGALAVANADVP